MGCQKLTYWSKTEIPTVRDYPKSDLQKIRGSKTLTPKNSVKNGCNYTGFGVELDSRTQSVSDYRYSFQGQEKDDEIKGAGNSVNYKYRMHDPRVGRFFAMDPIAKDFPWNSPYAFSENQVIHAVELEGLETSNDLNSRDPNVQKMTPEQKQSFYSGQRQAGAIVLVLAIDAFVTKGWLSRAYFLHELGSEMNATDRFHEAKANGNKESAAKYKQQMEAHGPGTALGAVAEIGPFAVASTMRYARESLATKWMGSASKTKYVDFNKPVYTSTIKKGTELVQFKVQGMEGTIGNYFAPVGTKPAQIGIDPNKVVETLNLTVTADTKVLVSTHTKNAPYYADKSVTLEGGGQQYYSKSLKENVTKTE